MGKIFGTRNDRLVKRYFKRIAPINAMEKELENLSDEELKSAYDELRLQVQNGEKTLDDVLVRSFAITREASKRTIGLRHYDVQLIGGIVLHEGNISEMKTGEGKTLVATLAVILNAMMGRGVHVVTVNDYLASRDANDMGPLYNFLGLSVGAITGDIHDDAKRKAQYSSDITYGTNNEFGFDYLRDNMKYSLSEKVQGDHYFAIVDEVDSILIDEARTPLIISGPTNRNLQSYGKANEISQKLEIETHFSVDEKNRTISLSEEGVEEAEKLFEVDNLYSLENAILSHHLDQSLKAWHLFRKDVDYVVKDGEIVIVDEFTGRLSEGRRYSEGLHQALEAKEGVKVQEESQTLADITFQNYFRLYDKLAGMTGTAQTEAAEFSQIYRLDVISIPTNVPVVRDDRNDLIYKSEREKFEAIIKKVKELHTKGQPALVGTASIEKSEVLHALLKKEKIPHTVLNAKQHAKEAQIILQAGQKGAVTIATNMAGRGVDIKLTDEIKALGGLYIIGTERHESRRIDNQLRGRSGRQGDPGVSQFYLSLEDNLLRIFGGERIYNIMEKLGIEEGEHIESKMVTRAVENAQKKVESLHFESRKHLLEFDDVANEQRKVIYNFRNELLNAEFDIDTKIKGIRAEYVTTALSNVGIFDGGVAEEFDLDGVTKFINEELYEEFEVSSYKELAYEELEQKIDEDITAQYEEKMSVVDAKQRSEIERILYLQVLDEAWREHLYQMDILKTGIGLRGYNQKDPLVEYKKESYNLFMELVERIKFQSLKTLHLVRLQSQEEQKEKQMMEQMIHQMQEENMDGMQLSKESVLEPTQNAPKAEKRPPRNEPCPCGSGKKYKYCCGQSGPKKGALAH
jgi:preprotein translocase subunit SecA